MLLIDLLFFIFLQNQFQNSNYAKGDVIHIPDVSIEVLKEFVEYCYVREVSTKMVSKYPLETILIAKRLKFLSLVEAMIRLLPLIVTSTNAVDLIVKSGESDCEIREPVQRYCLDFIRINFHEFDYATLVEQLPREALILFLSEHHPYT